jgi:polyisoprenoid-binding protein YceI
MRSLVLFMLLSGLNMSAFAKDFVIIREHSKIAFDIDYMSMTKIDGIFKTFYGDFKFDEVKKEISNVSVDVVAKSVDTSDEKRDFHLRGVEFFLVETNPIITFKSNAKAVLRADNSFSLPGLITMRGITKPFVLEGQYKGKNKDAWGKDSYFFNLTGRIHRKDFNMTWNKLLDGGGYLIGDVVIVHIAIQAQGQGEVTAFSTHMIPSTKGIVERDLLKRGKIKKLTTSTDPKDHEKNK